MNDGKTTSSQCIRKCALRNDWDRLIMKTNRTFRTLQGQVRALLTKILHNAQDNKTSMFKWSILVNDSFHLVQHGCITVDKSLFRLLCNIFSLRARSVLKILSLLQAQGRPHFTPRWRTTAGQAWLRGAARTSGWAPSQSGGTWHLTPSSLTLKNPQQNIWINVAGKIHVLRSNCLEVNRAQM